MRELSKVFKDISSLFLNPLLQRGGTVVVKGAIPRVSED
jgi:hypothetical protein